MRFSALTGSAPSLTRHAENDVSGGSHAILRVRQTFAGGFDTLTSWLIVRESILAAEANPSLVPLTDAALPNADSDPPSRGSQSLLGGIIGLKKPDLDARDAHERLYNDGVLQKLIKRTEGANGVEDGMMSRKAQKRAYQETKERAKRERTIARLERKVEEKEKKRAKREKKKELKKGSAAAATTVGSESGVRALVVQPLATAGAIEDAYAKEAALEGLASHDSGMGFIVDTLGAGRRAPPPAANDQDNDEDDSRYSLGVPAVARVAQQAGSTAASSRRGSPALSGPPGRYTHVTDDSSDSSGAEDGHADSDGDVVLGGGGGDFVRHDGVRPSRTASVESEDAVSDESAEVLATLVPAAKRPKVARNESSSEKRAASKAKAAKRAAFWGAKGPKTTSDGEE